MFWLTCKKNGYEKFTDCCNDLHTFFLRIA